MGVLTQVDLPDLKKVAEGKVRVMFDLGREMLIVTTDRISAFDVILPDGIPDKGAVLTQLSRFWFKLLKTPNHMITTEVGKMDAAVRSHAGILEGRSMQVRKAEIYPVECVARGYLIGSGWKDYQKTGSVCGIKLPGGLRIAEQLPEPIFTPATKATEGHDENISFERMGETVGAGVAEKLRTMTLDLYSRAAAYALERGLILADTKFEFGLCDGEIILCDEALTPDSSRYWPLDAWEPGRNPPSFDKQYVRDFLEEAAWDKRPPAPKLPPEVVGKTGEKYREAYRRLTGGEL